MKDLALLLNTIDMEFNQINGHSPNYTPTYLFFDHVREAQKQIKKSGLCT